MKNSKVKTIGMVVAMDKEITPFLNSLEGEKTTETVCGYNVCKYNLANANIVLIKSGIGEIYASGATAILINNYECDLILNFGLVGSLSSDIGVLSTVLVSGVCHYDFDLSPIDNVVVGQYPSYDGPVIKTDATLLELAKSVCGNVQVGICASADKFVADEKLKNKLHTTYNAIVCDMESAGIVLTANMAKVPVLIIKAVSDSGDDANGYLKNCHIASKVYIDVVKKLIEKV